MKEKIASIERLRIMAAFGIVWYHTEEAVGRSFGYAGLPIFLMLFCALVAGRSEPDDFAVIAKKKAGRLLKPWLFWSLVYAAAIVAKQSLIGGETSNTFAWHMFVTGPRIHLWYLPYAFVVSLALNALHRATMKISPIAAAIVAALIGAILLVSCSVLGSSVEMPIPLPQCSFGLPAVFLGFAIGRVYSSADIRKQRIFYLGVIAATVIACLTIICFNCEHMLVPYAVASVLVCGAFIWKGKPDPVSSTCGSLSYGIYLIHPLVAVVLCQFILRTPNPWIEIPVVFLLSLAATLVLKKTYFRQFV